MPPSRRWWMVGRKGLFLILFGNIWCLIGYSYLTGKTSSSGLRNLVAVLDTLPLTVQNWGAVWIAAGLLGIVCALTRHMTAGFAVLVAMPSWWAAVFLMSAAVYGVDLAWLGAEVYAALSLALALPAGMLEPRPGNGG